MKYLSLSVKVNGIILLSMILGIGTITFSLANSLIQTVDDLSRTEMMRQADTIYAAIESLMLPGEAPLAQGFFERLATLDPDQKTMLYRVDGTQAFQDNETIEHVNTIRNQNIFQPRSVSTMPIVTDPNEEGFVLASGGAGVPRDLFQRVESNGKVEYRVLRPLINLPKCIECHGSDHTVRGILEISSDISSITQIQQFAILSASGGFFFLVLVIGWGLSRSMNILVLKPIQTIGKVCDMVTLGNLDQRTTVNQKDEIGVLALRVNTMIEGLVERLKLTHYVSGSTVKSLSKSEEGKLVNLTLFFSDIRGFTSYTENNNPEHTVLKLNGLLDLQTKIIHSYDGDIDKYVGDEIFALFEGDRAVDRALDAAREIQNLINDAREKFDNLEIGIGIHKAQVILGRIGSENRADYTVIGDGVNTASRLCSAAKGSVILISETVYNEIDQKSLVEGPYRLKVKGKKDPLRVYRWPKDMNHDTP